MALSFGAGFLVAKKKFDDLNDTQIEEIKKMYETKYNKPQVEKTILKTEDKSNYWASYQTVIDIPKAEVKEKVNTNYESMIHVISPLEYGEDETYDVIGLTYYADGTLARDDDDTVIENIEDTIGIDSLRYLGEYADGVLYIKNDILGEYYEITDSDKTYTEMTGILQ